MTQPPALAPAAIADLLAASATTVVAELLALGQESGWRPAAAGSGARTSASAT